MNQAKTLQQEFDYIIVGAGSAGCVLANRLTEDANVSVLLLEAGPADRSLFIHMPGALSYPLQSTRYNWNYFTDSEPALMNRQIDVPRGRGLGGSSSINGMVFVRGNPLDYDGWAERGLPSWSFAHCLPYFRKMETYEGGADDYRGGDGPLRVSRCPADNPMFQAFLEAGRQAGYPTTPDHNGFRQEGMNVMQMTASKGRRMSTAVAYLRPAMGRANLTVRTETPVDRVRFDGLRAVGVDCRQAGAIRRADARREVIVSAGAIASPQLLLLSGVGNKEHLAVHGIPVVADVPGVGRDLQDHPAVLIQWEGIGKASPALQLHPLGQLKIGLQWLLFRNELGAGCFFETGGFLRSDDGQPFPNMQYEFLPMLGSFGRGKVTVAPGFQYSTSLMRPASRGWIQLAAADPRRHPAIRYNSLSEPEDQREFIAAVRITREIVRQKGWDPHRGRAVGPSPEIASDTDILGWLRANVGSEYHPAGSCRMGIDDMAVTDADGRVNGVEALRVVDASLMPRIVTANLNGPTIMMAEKLADRIRDRTPLLPLVLPFHRAGTPPAG